MNNYEIIYERYPNDAALGIQVTGSPSNWLSTPRGIGLFVSIFKARAGVHLLTYWPAGGGRGHVE